MHFLFKQFRLDNADVYCTHTARGALVPLDRHLVRFRRSCAYFTVCYSQKFNLSLQVRSGKLVTRDKQLFKWRGTANNAFPLYIETRVKVQKRAPAA